MGQARGAMAGPAEERGAGAVKELIRTNDPVAISFLVALLADAGIEAVVLDQHTSVLEGSINAIPRRIMVRANQFEHARRLLAAAEVLEGRWTRP